MDEHPVIQTHGAAATDEPYNASIVDWREVTEGRAIFRVAPDSGRVPPFRAGQYATLGLPREAPPADADAEFPTGDPRWKRLWRRAYSIASPPSDREALEFYLVDLPEGRLTPKLWHIRRGGRVWLDEHIRGEFTLDRVADGRSLVMIGSGTGIAPYLSMYRAWREEPRWRRFVLIESCRSHHDLGYRAELEAYAENDDEFVYLPTLTREPETNDWPGERGRVTDLIADAARFADLTGVELDDDELEIFLCGNPKMIEAAVAQLIEQNVPTERMHYERYW